MRVEAWLTRSARRFGDRIAVETVDRGVSYRELDRLAGAGARELSVAPGSSVAIALPPGIDFVVALHACMRAGAVAVPLDLREPLAAGRLAGATAEPIALQRKFPYVSGTSLGSPLVPDVRTIRAVASRSCSPPRIGASAH